MLSLPFAHYGDGFAPFIDALFTATSAATVTGLIVQDTGTYWTLGGQAVILLLMFIGGLGIMTIASALFILAGQRISLTQRLMIRETVGTATLTDITAITVRIVLWAVAIQLVGFLVLAVRFAFIYEPWEAVWHGLFQGVSGFNNAGFVSFPDANSLLEFRSDRIVTGVIAILILVGGLSYWVIDDVIHLRGFTRLTLNSKLVLVFTAGLLVVGTVGVLPWRGGELPNARRTQCRRSGDRLGVPLGQSHVRLFHGRLQRYEGGDQPLIHGAHVHRRRVCFGGRGHQGKHLRDYRLSPCWGLFKDGQGPWHSEDESPPFRSYGHSSSSASASLASTRRQSCSPSSRATMRLSTSYSRPSPR